MRSEMVAGQCNHIFVPTKVGRCTQPGVPMDRLDQSDFGI
jgi:hypothetical protein